MNTSNNAEYIQAVAGGQLPCPVCGSLNQPGNRFCYTCGADLMKKQEPTKAEGLRCPKCGTENEAGNRFCYVCGTELKEQAEAAAPAKPVCPKCGTENESGNRFCYVCGTPLIDGQTAQAEAAEEEEAEEAFVPEQEEAPEENTLADLNELLNGQQAEKATEADDFLPAETADSQPAFAAAQEAPAFETAEATPAVPAFGIAVEAPAFAQAEEAEWEETPVDEPVSAFAEGLPEWDIVPPQMLVRRHR